MAIQARTGSTLFADFLELVRGDQKADLIDGVIYMASPENLEHNELSTWLAGALGAYVRRRQLGRVVSSRVAFRLATNNSPEPDIAFIAASRLHLIRPGYVDGPPDVAIEIVSPDSVQRDYEQKRTQYETAGVAEYYIFDADERPATFLLREQERFVDRSPAHGPFESGAIAALRIDPLWLWQRPLPDALATVQQLLGDDG
ncbi:MAG: Uma2 family endonuclease [Phycisphaerae bacterium]